MSDLTLREHRSWLAQALRWWARSDGGPIPLRHFYALWKGGCIRLNADENWYELTRTGKRMEAASG